MKPKIDPEFAALIPPHSEADRTALEEGIRKDGCREPILVWLEEGVILDGHTRFDICTKLGLPMPEPRLESLPDRTAARIRIREIQMQRRNLTQYDVFKLAAGRLADLASQARERMMEGKSADGEAGGRGRKTLSGDQDRVSSPPRSPGTTNARLAEATGLSMDTVGKLIVCQKAGALTPEVEAALRDKKTTVNAEWKKVKGGKSRKPQKKPAGAKKAPAPDDTLGFNGEPRSDFRKLRMGLLMAKQATRALDQISWKDLERKEAFEKVREYMTKKEKW